jgi:hypothetical protein
VKKIFPEQSRGNMTLRSSFIVFCCALSLWFGASTDMHAVKRVTQTVQSHVHFALHHSEASVVLATIPQSLDNFCEIAEDTENEDAPSLEIVSFLLPVQALKPFYTFSFMQWHGRISVPLYVLHHNWKHYLPVSC